MITNIEAFAIGKVRKAMQDNAISQVEIARATGISASTLSNILAGKRTASVKLWQKIMDAAGVTSLEGLKEAAMPMRVPDTLKDEMPEEDTEEDDHRYRPGYVPDEYLGDPE